MSMTSGGCRRPPCRVAAFGRCYCRRRSPPSPSCRPGSSPSPGAPGRHVTPSTAAAAMSSSSLIVVGSALRLGSLPWLTRAPAHRACEANDRSGGGGTALNDNIPNPSRYALVVEAEPATVRLCRNLLESSGFIVDAVDSGIAAVRSEKAEILRYSPWARQMSGAARRGSSLQLDSDMPGHHRYRRS